jgi:hypothetical protein
MPKRSQVNPEFRRHVSEKINAYITDNQITDVKAAEVLGVRKQMIGPYRRGEALPGTEAIARACISWNISFSYGGFEISAKTLAGSNGRPKLVARQLELPFEEPIDFLGVSERVRNVRLTVVLREVS